MMVAVSLFRTNSFSFLPASFETPDFDDTAEKLETAYDRERQVVALTVPDREAIPAVARGRPSRVRRAPRCPA